MSKPNSWVKYSFTIAKFLFIVCTLFASKICIAQEEAEKPKTTNPQSKRRYKEITWVEAGDIKLRWQPLGLINVLDMNITVGAEFAYAKNRSFAFDAGYVFASAYGSRLRGESGDGIPPASGLIIRPSHRFYISKYNGWFIDLAATYKDVTYKNQPQWVGRNVVNGVPEFQERITFESRKEIFMFDAIIGLQENLDRKKNFNFEMWIGLGVRYRDFYAKLPPNTTLIGDNGFRLFDFGPRYGNFITPNLPGGFRLNYKIR